MVAMAIGNLIPISGGPWKGGSGGGCGMGQIFPARILSASDLVRMLLYDLLHRRLLRDSLSVIF